MNRDDEFRAYMDRMDINDEQRGGKEKYEGMKQDEE